MDLKLFAAVFLTVFLAELGDKTQLATVLFAGRNPDKLVTVFAAGSLALIAATVMAVAVGSFIASKLPPELMAYIAGAGFIVIGGWIIVSTRLGA